MSDWLYFYGMDMGHKDPFSLQIFAASPSDKKRIAYHVYGFERPGMYSRTIAQLLLGEDTASPLGCRSAANPGGLLGATGWPTRMVADVTGLGGAILDELRVVYGVSVLPAKQKDKFAAIEQVNGWLIDGKIKIMKGSILENQLMTLQWAVNEYGELKENKSQANHSTDAALYALREIAAMFDGVSDDAKPAAKHGTMSDEERRIASGEDLEVLEDYREDGGLIDDWT